MAMAVAAVVTIVSAVQYLVRFHSVLSGRTSTAPGRDSAASGRETRAGTGLRHGCIGVLGGARPRRMLAEGRQVRVLARSEETAAMLAALGAMVVRGDLFDHEALLRGMRGCGTVFHVAGANAMCARDPGPMLRVNVEGAAAVVRAAAAARVSRVVHTSSATTIGERTGRIGREDTPASRHLPLELRTPEGLGERRVLSLGGEARGAGRVGEPVVGAGPGRTGGSALLLLDIVNGRLPVLVNTWLSVVDIDDCTDAHLLAERDGAPGNRYLASGASFDVHGSDALRQASGRPRSVWFAPRALAWWVVPSPARWRACCGATAASATRRYAHCCTGTVSTRRSPSGNSACGTRRSRSTIRRALAWYADRGLAPPPIG